MWKNIPSSLKEGFVQKDLWKMMVSKQGLKGKKLQQE